MLSTDTGSKYAALVRHFDGGDFGAATKAQHYTTAMTQNVPRFFWIVIALKSPPGKISVQLPLW